MSESPFISVIVPVYNVEKYLKQCVESVLNQSFSDFEIVLINDGSTDNSGKICDSFVENNAKVKVIHKQNEGVGLARNSGLRQATGQYIYFLDSDDFVEPNFFDVLILNTNTNPDIIQFGFNRLTKFGKYVNSSVPATMEIKSLSIEKAQLSKILNSGCGLAVWDKLIKRELLLENKIFFDNKKRGEDFTFVTTLYHYTKTIVVLNKALVNYRIIMGTGKKFDLKLIQNHLESFSSLKTLLNDNSLSSEKYLKKIFSVWFFKVIPINIAADRTKSKEEKINSLKNLILDIDFLNFLQNIDKASIGYFDKLMTNLYLNQKYVLIIKTGEILRLTRKIIFK